TRAPGILGAPAQVAPKPASPAPAAPGNTLRNIGFVIGGAGIGGLGIGGVAAGLAALKKADLDKSGACVKSTCNLAALGDVESYNLLGNVSSVGVLVRGSVAVSGAVLVTVAYVRGPAQVHATVGPGRAGLTLSASL